MMQGNKTDMKDEGVLVEAYSDADYAAKRRNASRSAMVCW